MEKMFKNVKKVDGEVYNALIAEKNRQNDNIELIASENYVSKAVLEVQGSLLTNKYAEGYSGARYYGGCQNIDVIETLAKERLKELFKCKYCNVQPHSGSQANMGAIRALIGHGDKILGMGLNDGGHLTHGYKLSFSGQDYEAYTYGVDVNTGLIDYDEVLKIALKVKPKLIICGASAYPRKISFKKFRKIADEVGAYLMADIAHIAGLCATGLHESPIKYCDVITSTTHKTLRGPRGGIIMTNSEEIAKKVDRAIFPGTQGGPLEHIIGAKAVAFKEALDPSFSIYMRQVVANCKAFASEFKALGYKVVSNGTDNHLLLLDVKSSIGLTGKVCEDLLEEVNITINKNTIPGDMEKPMLASGIRLGTAAMTSRGYVELDFRNVAHLIDTILRNPRNIEAKADVIKEVKKLNKKHQINK
ncbi:MAG TPA: serine hydroxymethyltransferase [Lachnospiraceae bacterium]|nr:serine hydroxymethyltransferase [Lachnospiraceae bacterium]